MMTRIGVILGTAAYMSPEQAKGRAADKRSDVWAFGCVLYEMVTGRRAFEGEDISDTLAAVLRGEPDWTALPANMAPAIVALLRGCLDKDQRRRIGDLSTARFIIDVSNGHQPQLNDDDRYTLRRYAGFRAAAGYVAEAFARVPTVRRIALFGSVASSPRIESGRRRHGYLHEPKDVDLAVWLDDVVDLDRLRKLSAQALNRLWHDKEMGVAHHQIDIFLVDATGKYLGRLCHFSQCPKHKPQCRAEGCGKVPFLQQHDGFVFDSAESLHPARILVLYERR
jgi:Protein kinase domain